MARASAGKVVNVTERGVLVKAPAMVPIGTTLVDVRNQPVGRVADVIGPVSGPYLVVSPPRKGKTSARLDREVFLP